MRLQLPILMTVALMVSACFTPETPLVPQWVEHPPEATATQLYGVSVAKTYEGAYISAIGGIAAGVLEASEVHLNQTVTDKALRKKITLEMKKVVTETKYTDVKLEQRAAMGEDTAVMVSMPRSTFAAKLASRLDKDSETIQKRLENLKGTSEFKQLGVLGALHEEQPHLLAEITLLEAVNPAVDSSPYRKLSEQIDHDFNTIKFGLNVTVISDANAIVFVDTIKEALRAEGMSGSGQTVGTLLLYADNQQELRGGTYLVKTRVRFKSTVKGKSIAQNEFYLQGNSDNGYLDARRQTADGLQKAIKKEGFFHVLGF